MFPVIGLILAWVSLVLNPMFIHLMGLHGAGLSVLIGLLAVLFIHSDFRQITSQWQSFPSVFWKNEFDHKETIQKLINWSQMVRKSGPLVLETVLESEKDEYLNLGLQYIIDNVDKAKLKRNLGVASDTRLVRWRRLKDLFEYLARSAIGLGLCFMVLGWIDMLTSLELMGISVNLFVPSLAALGYGLGLAYFFFYPLSARLSVKMAQRVRFDEMALDGFVAIVDQENARIMAHRLQEYID